MLVDWYQSPLLTPDLQKWCTWIYKLSPSKSQDECAIAELFKILKLLSSRTSVSFATASDLGQPSVLNVQFTCTSTLGSVQVCSLGQPRHSEIKFVLFCFQVRMKSKKEITIRQHRFIKNKSCQTSLISFCERETVHVDREKKSVLCVLTAIPTERNDRWAYDSFVWR